MSFNEKFSALKIMQISDIETWKKWYEWLDGRMARWSKAGLGTEELKMETLEDLNVAWVRFIKNKLAFMELVEVSSALYEKAKMWAKLKKSKALVEITLTEKETLTDAKSRESKAIEAIEEYLIIEAAAKITRDVITEMGDAINKMGKVIENTGHNIRKETPDPHFGNMQ